MVKVSMPLRDGTRGSDPMKAIHGNRTHIQAVSSVQVAALYGGRATLSFLLPSVQPYQVTTLGPSAALLYYCRLYVLGGFLRECVLA